MRHTDAPQQNPKIQSLKISRPGIYVSILWSIDTDYVWDGEPSQEPGSPPYVAEVRAVQIVDGKMYSGSDYLGGCYPEEDGFDPEISGYFPQMLDDALAYLDENLANDGHKPVDLTVYPNDPPTTAAVKPLYCAVTNTLETLNAAHKFNGYLCLTTSVARSVRELQKILTCYKKSLKF